MCFYAINCSNKNSNEEEKVPMTLPEGAFDGVEVQVGAERMEDYLSSLQGKKIALAVNQTSLVKGIHLVDTLFQTGIQLSKIFSPEHGFRGEADAGEKIVDAKDPKTGVPIVSLYGAKRKPAAADLKDVELVVFDIQDVGARFYTYISTLHYLMQACAENNIPLLVLDRPNPNGHFVDGPVLDTSLYRSFVGMHPIPIVHGMTIGEYALMVNGEGWLGKDLYCNLRVVKCMFYNHKIFYNLPVKPSPNLPNMHAIYLYPSTCLFEGTVASEGRGTDRPFQQYGHPDFPGGNTTFTPVSISGANKPKLEGKPCKGYDWSKVPIDSLRAAGRVNLSYLIEFYNQFPDKDKFFLPNLYFDKLAGGKTLREQIIAGLSEKEIRQSWDKELWEFTRVRKKYLLYPDFDD